MFKEDFFKDNVIDKAGGAIAVKEKAKNLNKSLFGLIKSGSTPTPTGRSKGDGELNVKNRVLVGVFGNYMFILKEKWVNWS